MADFVFGQKFQEEMLALMLRETAFAIKASLYVPEERLYSDSHKFLFKFIKSCVDKGGYSPSIIEIEDRIKIEDRAKRRMLNGFVTKINELPVTDAQYVKQKLGEYAKRNVFVNIFSEAQSIYNTGKHEESYDFMIGGLNELNNVSFGDDLNIAVEDFEDLRRQYIHDSLYTLKSIPTGISPIDKILRGGLAKTEMGIILGEAKKGKSIGLLHMGVACLQMYSGRVAHFVLEGSTEQTSMRYQSRLTQIPYNRIRSDSLDEFEEQKLDLVGKKYLQNLELIPFNTRWDYTVGDIEAKVLEMERFGRKPDLVIVDYGDLLTVPNTNRFIEYRHQQTAVFRGLKQLAMIYKVALWTASQSIKPKDDPEKETILRAKDIAESYEKVRITDFLMTLNQTPREKIQGILRAHVDIYRDNETDKTFPLLCDFSRMIFYSPIYGHIESYDRPRWNRAKIST